MACSRISKIVILTWFLVLPLSLTSCSSGAKSAADVKKEGTHRETTNRKNINWDKSVGEKAYHQQLQTLRKKKVNIDNDQEMIAKLNRILEKLRPHTLMSDLPYEVHYVDHKTVNAVCYPAGHILFFKGIFDPKQGLIDPNNEDEIAAVMGHEIAHATLRHSYRTHRKAQTTSILGNIASIFVGSAGSAASQIFSAVFDVTTGLYFPSHSRKQEAASDLEGVYTMMGAGYDPASAVTLWERAAQRKGGGKTSFFATHPSSRHRAKLLQAHIDNIRAQK